MQAMWICPKCSEQHEDQFDVCWKCSSDDLKTAVTATPPPSSSERELRPFRDIVVRALAGFLIGFLVTMMLLTLGNSTLAGFMPDNSLTAATLVSLLGGLLLGAVVGSFFWVLFPYAPLPRQMLVDTAPESRQDKESNRSH
jgi:hypothetical protein